MSTELGRAIDALSKPDVRVADALRLLLVVSRRIKAADATAWLQAELGGFQGSEPLPAYRLLRSVAVEVRFEGPMGMSASRTFTHADLGELGSVVGEGRLPMPVAELAALADEDNLRMPLTMAWLQQYRLLAEEGKVPGMEMMVANDAYIRIPKALLAGVLDRIKSAALDLALDIEAVATDAGRVSGPTTASDSDLARAVTTTITHIYASDSTITVGDNASVATGEYGTAGQTVVQVGDVAGLLDAARSFLADDGVKALAQALEDDNGQPGNETRSFLERVKSGTYGLAAGLTVNGAYDGLAQLLRMAFPEAF